MDDHLQVRDALRPTTDALLCRARQAAADEFAAAETDAREQLDDARANVAAIREQARARGAANAKESTRVGRVRAQRQGRGRTLEAMREAFESVRTEALDLAMALTNDPRWPSLQQALASAAAGLAGPGSVVVDDPRGGVVVTGREVVVDFSLPALAAAAFDEVSSQAERLWA